MGIGKLHYFPMIKETTTTTGTGFLTLDGAVPGFATFASRYSTNEYFHYIIVDPTNDEWEVSVGSLNVSGNLIRWTANNTEQSSNGLGTTLNLQAGTKYVGVIDGRVLASNISLSPDLLTYANLPECGVSGVVAIGQRALANGLDAFAIGKDANASGFDSFALGENAEATNDRAIAQGINAYATQDDTLAIGNNAHAIHNNAFSFGRFTRSWSHSMVSFGTGLRSQTGFILVSGETSSTTPLILRTDNSGADSVPKIEYSTSSDEKAVYLRAVLFGHDKTNDNAFVHEYTLAGVVDAGDTTANQMGTTTDNTILETGGMTGASATVVVDGATGEIRVTVTGLALTNIQWVCRIEFLASWHNDTYGGAAH